jgi:hypothetical protein
MSLRKAKEIAEEAAELADPGADPNHALRLLCEAVAELARSLEARLTKLERESNALMSEVRRLR